MSNTLSLAQSIIEKAKKAGADAADALVIYHDDLNVRVRMGKVETIERAQSKDLGLRVLMRGKEGNKSAVVSSNNFDEAHVAELIERAIDMAKAAPEDTHTRLARANELATSFPALDLADKATPSEKDVIQMASNCESAALAQPGITNSEGSEADFGRSEVALVTSEGFAQGYSATSGSVSASIIAGEGLKMETDYDYAVARHFAELGDGSAVGTSAAKRALARLNPRKVKTCQVPVIFDARTARGLLSEFISAVNGSSIARGTSFLKDKMGQQIFANNIHITDNPHVQRGLASHPFDGEGIAGKELDLVQEGVLKSWLLDLRSASKLGLATTGHATRGTSGPPSPSSTNVHMHAGTASLEELMADMKEGLLVTDAFGMGCNMVTGDYSQGASGFWIEKGKISYAVSEITIAGNMLDMFKRLTPANDLEFKFSTNCPSLRIENLTIAGT